MEKGSCDCGKHHYISMPLTYGDRSHDCGNFIMWPHYIITWPDHWNRSYDCGNLITRTHQSLPNWEVPGLLVLIHWPKTTGWASETSSGQQHKCKCKVKQGHLKRLLPLQTGRFIKTGLQLLEGQTDGKVLEQWVNGSEGAVAIIDAAYIDIWVTMDRHDDSLIPSRVEDSRR